MIRPIDEEERVKMLASYLFHMFAARAAEIPSMERFWHNEAVSLGWTE